MADQFNLNQLLGGGLPAGLLSPEQEAAAQQRAQAAGLLNFAFGALQASRGAPGQGRPSLGQIIGQAGPVGVAGYQQSFENTLANALRGMQIQEMRAKQSETERQRKAREEFEKNISGATVNIPTAQGFRAQQSNIAPEQLEGMSLEQVAQQAVQAGMPTQRVTDPMAADKAVMDYLRVSAPAEYAKLLVREPRALPSSIQEYQFAVSQGFKGTFAEFQEQMKKAGATNINMPSGEERKAGFLANRVKFGLEQMAEVIKQSPPSASPEALPTLVKFVTGSDFLSNKLTSAERQQIEAAQLDILDAALTLGTGAAYTREQLEGYRKAYFPQLGDDKATIAGKQRRLENLLQSSYISAGRASPAGQPPLSVAPVAPAAPTAPATPAGSRNQLRNMLFPQRQ
jgi:formamidopyrimidine-DNA glycosylase